MTKLQKYLEQEDKDQGAGFWGHAMQVIYQVSLSEPVFVSLFGACLCLLHSNMNFNDFSLNNIVCSYSFL